ncbi:MAG: FAD-binding oxidoreductase [Pseudomonadota bacterium]
MLATSPARPASHPFWWEEAGAPTAPTEVPLPREIEVAVIGGGLTGLSAARTLARHGRSVLVLDAGAPGIGASSRNGGMIGGGHRMSIDAMEARFGRDTAIALLREAHLEATAFSTGLIAEEGIDCGYIACGRFRGLWTAAEYNAAGRALDRLQALIPLEASMVPEARQHEEVATDLYAGGTVYPSHGRLNPAQFAAGLLAAVERAGACVQGNTPVLALRREGTGHRVETPRGAVQAGAVLVATNGYTPAALPEHRRRIVPIPSFLVATEPLGQNRVRSLFPSDRMVAESRDRHCYYRPSPCDTRLVFGGRAAMMEVPERFAISQLRGLLAQIFPQLGRVSFTHAWRGRTGFTFHALPSVGQLDGLWHAMGYSGSGNAMAPYLGHKAALGILGLPEGETAFARTGLPTRWWHRGTPWFLPFADLFFRAGDLRASLARRS